jgi:hypothetical protein
MALEIKYELKDFDKGQIIDKFGMQDGGNADLFLANTCFRRMVKYTPWDTGIMATDVTIKPKKIIYNQEYAIYQYNGITKGPVTHYSNNYDGLRGKQWDLRMYNNEKHIIAREVEDYVRKTEKR